MQEFSQNLLRLENKHRIIQLSEINNIVVKVFKTLGQVRISSTTIFLKSRQGTNLLTLKIHMNSSNWILNMYLFWEK